MLKKCANCYYYFKCEYAKASDLACRGYEPEQVNYDRPATRQEILVKALRDSYDDLVDDYTSAWEYINTKVMKANL